MIDDEDIRIYPDPIPKKKRVRKWEVTDDGIVLYKGQKLFRMAEFQPAWKGDGILDSVEFATWVMWLQYALRHYEKRVESFRAEWKANRKVRKMKP